VPTPAPLLAAAVAAALTRALHGDLAAGCSASELRSVAHDAGFTKLGSIGTSSVVLAAIQRPCLCGNVNCPYLVLRLDPDGASRVLLSTYAYDVHAVGNAQPLPNLHETAHDSALVSVETTDAFRGANYVAVATARVRGDTGARKPDRIPLRFAPGASSAVLTGRISAGWYDTYSFAALRGQRVTIAATRLPDGTTFRLNPAGGGGSIELRPGVPAVLPAGGAYLLTVDTGSMAERAYRATIAIR
jgi:hypothetical protein